jgi:DNA-binding GntR family transcriptional regulator
MMHRPENNSKFDNAVLDELGGITKSEKVYEYLKNEILMAAYKPGDRIVIREVSKQLGVSDIPVREAIKKMASEGLLEVKSHSGARVATINIENLEEIFLIRTELETLATLLAAKSATSEEIAKLDKCVRKMDESYEKHDVVQYTTYNRKFHQMLYRASHAPLLVDMIENMYARSERSRTIFLLEPERMKISNEEHREITEALRNRDEEKAAKVMRAQKEHGFKSVLNTLMTTRSFFGR